jgi:hypothetical protein
MQVLGDREIALDGEGANSEAVFDAGGFDVGGHASGAEV